METWRIIAAIAAAAIGFVLAIFLEKRIHRWVARVTVGSGWRALGLLVAYIAAVAVMGVLLMLGIPPLERVATWAADAVLLLLIVVVMTVTVPFMSPTGTSGAGPLTVAGDIERAGGRGIAPKVLGCGGALVMMAVGLSAALALGAAFILE